MLSRRKLVGADDDFGVLSISAGIIDLKSPARPVARLTIDRVVRQCKAQLERRLLEE